MTQLSDDLSRPRVIRLSWPAVIISYFLLQAGYRWVIGGNLGLDEAEIIIDARRLAWGYGAQPPLYAWLQWGFFRLIPDPLLAMALLKNALLAGTFLAVYALLRGTHPPRVAALATGSMMLLPQIAWESQRALTHSVLVTALAALAALVFWSRPAGRGGGAGLGAVVGLGAIAKANFGFAMLGLWLAAATMPAPRAWARPSVIAAGLAVAMAITAGPILWAARHSELAFASSYKFGFASGAGRIATAAQGMGALAAAVAGFLALLVVVILPLRLAFARGEAPPPPAPLDRFLPRVAACGLVLVALAILMSGATSAKDRWLQPVLFLAAPAATLWLLPRVTPAGARWLGRAIALCAALVVIGLPVSLVTGTPGRPARGDAPIGLLADDLAARFTGTDRVLADPWLAGNLLYRRPDWDVGRASTATLGPGEGVLLVWQGDAASGARIAAEIAARSGRVARLGPPVRFIRQHAWQRDHAYVLHAARLVAS